MDVERKRIEEALRANERRARDLFASLPIGIYRTTPDGRILLANPALLRMLGFDSFAEAAGQNLEEHSHSLYPRRLFKERLERDGEIRGLEAVWRRRDGTTVCVRENTRAVRDHTGRILYYEGAVEDITERKQAEEALRESEERFRRYFQLGLIGMAITSPTKGFVEANDELCRILGYERNELLHKTWAELTHPDDLATDVAQFNRVMAGELDGYTLDKRFIRKDGRIIYVTISGKCLRNANGSVDYFVVLVQDITERRQAELERIELLRQLVTVQEEERRRIALEIHDQLGQDVAALMLGLKVLQDSGALPAHDKRLLQLMALTDQLGREAHRLAWELRPSALDDLGLEVTLKNYLDEWAKRFALTVDFHQRGLPARRLPPPVETAVYRIVQEALTNVSKHAQAKHVSVLLEYHDQRLLVIVEDDGRGFDSDEVLSAANTTQRMGLVGMQERARLVGGELELESAPGAGTTVYVRVPISQ